MKSEPFDQSDGSLRQVLQQWRVETPLPPRFQEGVWRRIELNETRSSGSSSLVSRIVAGIARPSLAASYFVILLLAGVLTGYWQARVSNAHAEQLLSARYVQVVDPYQSLHQTSP